MKQNSNFWRSALLVRFDGWWSEWSQTSMNIYWLVQDLTSWRSTAPSAMKRPSSNARISAASLAAGRATSRTTVRMVMTKVTSCATISTATVPLPSSAAATVNASRAATAATTTPTASTARTSWTVKVLPVRTARSSATAATAFRVTSAVMANAIVTSTPRTNSIARHDSQVSTSKTWLIKTKRNNSNLQNSVRSFKIVVNH